MIISISLKILLLITLCFFIPYLCKKINEKTLRQFLIEHRKNESLRIKIARECDLIEYIIEILPEYENWFPKHTQEEWEIIRNKVNEWKLSEKSKNL